MTEEILICDCGSVEHQIIVRYFDDEDEVYLDIHLTKRSFLKRLKYAFKYVFGYKSKYGAWDEFIFKPEHVDKLKMVIEKLEQNGKN